MLNWAGSPRFLFLPHSQLPELQRKTIPWQTVECCTWILVWAHSFLKQEIINFPSAVWAMLALRLTCIFTLHLAVKLFRPFLFNFVKQVLPCYQLLVSRNSPLTEQCKNKINTNSFIFVTWQCDTHYFEPHRTKSDCLFAIQTCIKSISLPTKKMPWKEMGATSSWSSRREPQGSLHSSAAELWPSWPGPKLARPKAPACLSCSAQESWQGAPAASSRSYCFLLKWKMSLLWHKGPGLGWRTAFQEHLASLKCFTALKRESLIGSGSQAVWQEGRLHFPFS